MLKIFSKTIVITIKKNDNIKIFWKHRPGKVKNSYENYEIL